MKDVGNYVEEKNITLESQGMLSKMGAKMGIQKEVRNDNSDSAIAEMLIQGIEMGSLDMEKEIKAFQDDVDGDVMKLAKEFLKFQEETKTAFKKYL